MRNFGFALASASLLAFEVSLIEKWAQCWLVSPIGPSLDGDAPQTQKVVWSGKFSTPAGPSEYVGNGLNWNDYNCVFSKALIFPILKRRLTNILRREPQSFTRADYRLAESLPPTRKRSAFKRLGDLGILQMEHQRIMQLILTPSTRVKEETSWQTKKLQPLRMLHGNKPTLNLRKRLQVLLTLKLLRPRFMALLMVCQAHSQTQLAQEAWLTLSTLLSECLITPHSTSLRTPWSLWLQRTTSMKAQTPPSHGVTSPVSANSWPDSQTLDSMRTTSDWVDALEEFSLEMNGPRILRASRKELKLAWAMM